MKTNRQQKRQRGLTKPGFHPWENGGKGCSSFPGLSTPSWMVECLTPPSFQLAQKWVFIALLRVILTQCFLALLCGETLEVSLQSYKSISLAPRILHQYRSHSQASLDSSSSVLSCLPPHWYQPLPTCFWVPPLRWLAASSRSSQMPCQSPTLHPSLLSADKSWKTVSFLHCRRPLSLEWPSLLLPLVHLPLYFQMNQRYNAVREAQTRLVSGEMERYGF